MSINYSIYNSDALQRVRLEIQRDRVQNFNYKNILILIAGIGIGALIGGIGFNGDTGIAIGCCLGFLGALLLIFAHKIIVSYRLNKKIKILDDKHQQENAVDFQKKCQEIRKKVSDEYLKERGNKGPSFEQTEWVTSIFEQIDQEIQKAENDHKAEEVRKEKETRKTERKAKRKAREARRKARKAQKTTKPTQLQSITE